MTGDDSGATPTPHEQLPPVTGGQVSISVRIDDCAATTCPPGSLPATGPGTVDLMMGAVLLLAAGAALVRRAMSSGAAVRAWPPGAAGSGRG